MKAFKISLALFCALSLFASFAFGQDAPSASGSQSAAAQTGVSAQAQALPDESTLAIADTPAAAGPSAFGQPSGASTVWVFFRMIFVLIVVVVCIYLVMSFMRRKLSGGGQVDDDTFLRKVAQISVAPGKSVQIVTLLERAYLIGVTDNSIDLLGEISDKELVDAMNLNADRNQAKTRARNFADILSLFLNPKNPNATEGERKASTSVADFFKTQKEKLSNGK